MDIKDLAESGAKIASLTGTGKLNLTQDDKNALKAFVGGGGVLFVDASGGSIKFAKSAERILEEIFGKRSLRPLPSTSVIYKLNGVKEDMEIDQVRFRSKTKARMGTNNKSPNLRAVLDKKDRPVVIFSPEDITAGLVGYPAHTIDGYERDSAFELMRNIVLYASGKDAKVEPAAK